MKQCRLCKKDIEDRAKKCDKCGAYQSFFGRFVHMGIPVISILLALVSWGQTYMENLEKKEAVEDKIVAEKKAVKAEKKEEQAVEEKEVAQQKVVEYNETLMEIENEVRYLKEANVEMPEYHRRLDVISDRIDLTRQPVKVIDGQRYKRIDEYR